MGERVDRRGKTPPELRQPLRRAGDRARQTETWASGKRCQASIDGRACKEDLYISNSPSGVWKPTVEPTSLPLAKRLQVTTTSRWLLRLFCMT